MKGTGGSQELQNNPPKKNNTPQSSPLENRSWGNYRWVQRGGKRENCIMRGRLTGVEFFSGRINREQKRGNVWKFQWGFQIAHKARGTSKCSEGQSPAGKFLPGKVFNLHPRIVIWVLIQGMFGNSNGDFQLWMKNPTVEIPAWKRDFSLHPRAVIWVLIQGMLGNSDGDFKLWANIVREKPSCGNSCVEKSLICTPELWLGS